MEEAGFELEQRGPLSILGSLSPNIPGARRPGVGAEENRVVGRNTLAPTAHPYLTGLHPRSPEWNSESL